MRCTTTPVAVRCGQDHRGGSLSNPFNEKTVTYVQETKQPESHHEIGGTFGGPLTRDRLFFFVSLLRASIGERTITCSPRDRQRPHLAARPGRFRRSEVESQHRSMTSHVTALAMRGVRGRHSAHCTTAFGTNWISSSQGLRMNQILRAVGCSGRSTRRHARCGDSKFRTCDVLGLDCSAIGTPTEVYGSMTSYTYQTIASARPASLNSMRFRPERRTCRAVC